MKQTHRLVYMVSVAYTMSLLLSHHNARAGEGVEAIPASARQAWTASASERPCASGTVTVEFIRTDGQNLSKTSTTVRKIKSTPFAALLEVSSKDTQQRAWVLCSNSRYAFSISRKDSATEFRLDSYSEDRDKVFSQYLPQSVREEVSKLLSITYWAGDMRASDLLNPREFDIAIVTASPERAGATRVVFRKTPQAKLEAAQSGWFDTDPSEAWAITSGEFSRIEDGQPITYQYRTVIKSVEHNVPIPKERVVTASVKKNDGSSASLFIRTSYDMERCETISESEFTLSAFGLPEPPGVVWEKPTPRYIWFLVAAMVFVAIAVGFRYLARRRSTRLPA